ncbi:MULTISPECIES: carbohydrate-binding protein [Streptomyces]|uniref:Carbohydrate-binding protein n=2 Tax=Streptomyces TaxID=1883 RepID=A0A100Y2L8_9ACTN|nr:MULTISPECIES: carbohydrate-binding protein [Streptomyces]KUH36559.1 carbohydrate-binding protein [Streptomyces kanasensis]UUS31744.1 carbohydrate-binding protein [Streptomyces changanensis]
MAAGNHGNGAGTPEDDDPFGYLYADGQASGAQPPGSQGGYGYPGPTSGQPGRPRTSYNQVRAVGERPRPQVPPQPQYGQAPGAPYGQAPGAPYGQQPGAPYGQPHAQYAAPETYPGGAPTRPGPAHGGRGGRGGPNTKGLLIGAVAVVLVVVVGITVALLTNGDDDKDKANPAPGASVSASQEPGDTQPSPSTDPGAAQPQTQKRDAATLQLTPPAVLGTEVKGAKGADGAYVMFNGVGGAASWKVDVPEDGQYTLFLTYSVPGKDAKASLTVNNGKPRKINMSNFAHAPEGSWEKGWTETYSWVQLHKGENTLKMSCEPGNDCDAYLDQVWLKPGQLRRDS